MSGFEMCALSKKRSGKRFSCRERFLKVRCGRMSRTAMKLKSRTRRLKKPSTSILREDRQPWLRRFRNIGSTFRSFAEPESVGREDPLHFLHDLGSEGF